MKRRNFLKTALAGTAALIGGAIEAGTKSPLTPEPAATPKFPALDVTTATDFEGMFTHCKALGHLPEMPEQQMATKAYVDEQISNIHRDMGEPLAASNALSGELPTRPRYHQLMAHAHQS